MYSLGYIINKRVYTGILINSIQCLIVEEGYAFQILFKKYHNFCKILPSSGKWTSYKKQLFWDFFVTFLKTNSFLSANSGTNILKYCIFWRYKDFGTQVRDVQCDMLVQLFLSHIWGWLPGSSLMQLQLLCMSQEVWWWTCRRLNVKKRW